MYRQAKSLFQLYQKGPKYLSSLFNHNAGQIKLEVILTEFNSIDNIDIVIFHEYAAGELYAIRSQDVITSRMVIALQWAEVRSVFVKASWLLTWAVCLLLFATAASSTTTKAISVAPPDPDRRPCIIVAAGRPINNVRRRGRAEFAGPENGGPKKNKDWKSRAGKWRTKSLDRYSQGSHANSSESSLSCVWYRQLNSTQRQLFLTRCIDSNSVVICQLWCTRRGRQRETTSAIFPRHDAHRRLLRRCLAAVAAVLCRRLPPAQWWESLTCYYSRIPEDRCTRVRHFPDPAFSRSCIFSRPVVVSFQYLTLTSD